MKKSRKIKSTNIKMLVISNLKYEANRVKKVANEDR